MDRESIDRMDEQNRLEDLGNYLDNLSTHSEEIELDLYSPEEGNSLNNGNKQSIYKAPPVSGDNYRKINNKLTDPAGYFEETEALSLLRRSVSLTLIHHVLYF